MKRSFVAALLAATALLTACSGDPPDTTGDSVTENQNTEGPAPVPS